MPDSPNLVLPYIQASQAQKHVTHNEAIRLLDGMVQLGVVSQGLTAPPGSPIDGERYIVGSGATGLWAGWDLNVAFWVDGAWVRLIPRVGWLAYVVGSSGFYSWRGSAWVVLSGGGGGGPTFPDNTFGITNAADATKNGVFDASGITTATTRTFTLPNTSSELAILAGTQTFTGAKTFTTGVFTVSSSTATLGNGTGTTTANVASGATTTGLTKTANIGTGGASGSTTVVNIGSAVAGALGTTVINSPTVTFASTVSGVAMAAANLSALYCGLGGATADATNRLSINTPAALFNNAGSSIAITLNKNAAANDASFTFQTGFSTRAIFGINGSDDCGLKVSPNGSSFFDAYSVARATGRITVANGLVLNPAAGDLASPVDGALWYNSTTAKFRGRQNGASVDLIQFPQAIFGDGSDGSVTISSGTTTLTRDMFYQNLTINGTGVLATAGFKVYVAGTLDISAAAAGSIINNGGAGGAGATAGTAGTSGAAPGLGTTLANGTVNAAGAGGVAAGTAAGSAGGAQTGVIAGGHAVGGAGGLGASGAGGAGTPLSTATAVGASFRRFVNDFVRVSAGVVGAWSTSKTGSGGGGGGDATAGAGGGGCGGQGGAVVIYANIIARGTNVAVGIIQALGGLAGAGGSATAGNRGGGGGGSGGPGGFVYICFGLLTGSTITNAIDVTGGNGATGGNGFGTGIGGGGGGSGGGGRVVQVDVDNGTGSELVSSNGTAGTTTATITGGAGATATVSRANL